MNIPDEMLDKSEEEILQYLKVQKSLQSVYSEERAKKENGHEIISELIRFLKDLPSVSFLNVRSLDLLADTLTRYAWHAKQLANDMEIISIRVENLERMLPPGFEVKREEKPKPSSDTFAPF